jgi:hypothetical protein
MRLCLLTNYLLTFIRKLGHTTFLSVVTVSNKSTVDVFVISNSTIITQASLYTMIGELNFNAREDTSEVVAESASCRTLWTEAGGGYIIPFESIDTDTATINSASTSVSVKSYPKYCGKSSLRTV